MIVELTHQKTEKQHSVAVAYLISVSHVMWTEINNQPSSSYMTLEEDEPKKSIPASGSADNMIDNSDNFYVPVGLKCGVVVMARPDVWKCCSRVFCDLNDDLTECLRILPNNLRGLVKRTRIWVNATYQYGPVNRPKVQNHSTAHHHEGWLLW